MSHLFPNEILTEIFSRTPAKSVGKFRCLSKTWNNILSSPHFIKMHLSRNTHQQSLILSTPDHSLHVVEPPFGKPTISNKLELGNADWTRVFGSCNGLVFLSNWKCELFLVNPITLELFKVPKLTFDDSMKRVSNLMLGGFGYDSSTDDYKIVELSHFYSTVSCSVDISVSIYSVKSGVWKSIDHSLYPFADSGRSSGSYCGVLTIGSIHWYVDGKQESKTSCGILAFNLATEVFYEVDVPLAFSGICRVFAHEMHLCVLNPLETDDYPCRDSGKIEVWMLKEYGNVNSWTKLGTFDEDNEWLMEEPVYFSRDEEVVLITDQETMVVCNLQAGTVKDIIVDGSPAYFSDGYSFVGSLVSLNLIISSG